MKSILIYGILLAFCNAKIIQKRQYFGSQTQFAPFWPEQRANNPNYGGYSGQHYRPENAILGINHGAGFGSYPLASHRVGGSDTNSQGVQGYNQDVQGVQGYNHQGNVPQNNFNNQANIPSGTRTYDAGSQNIQNSQPTNIQPVQQGYQPQPYPHYPGYGNMHPQWGFPQHPQGTPQYNQPNQVPIQPHNDGSHNTQTRRSNLMTKEEEARLFEETIATPTS